MDVIQPLLPQFPSKTEFTIVGLSHQIKKSPILQYTNFPTSCIFTTARNFGVAFDPLSSNHNSSLLRSCYMRVHYQLIRLHLLRLHGCEVTSALGLAVQQLLYASIHT